MDSLLRRIGRSVSAAFCCWCFGCGTVQAACADVALIPGMDASGSISDAEFAIQKAGYVAALTDPVVQSAFDEAGVVDIASLFWADSAYGVQIVPWQRIKSSDDLSVFASRLAATARKISGNTDIGVGILAATELFTEDGRCADRMVLDISGDGRANATIGRARGVALEPARKQALDLGVTINGLAIADKDGQLGEYYSVAVIGGIGSFVIEVDGLTAFPVALRRKLHRELLALNGGGCPQMPGPDCQKF